MENKFIYRDMKVNTGRIMHQHPVLSGCYNMEVDGIGYGPRFTIEIIPKNMVFNSVDEVIKEIDSDIDFLQRQKIKAIELDNTKSNP